MSIIRSDIDGGRAFDWGRVSAEYAKFRDIYPKEFYEKILARNLCQKRQNILDIGTGTGVLPRNLYRYGAKWVGIDASKAQIEQARALSKGMDIDYIAVCAENIDFAPNSFDAIIACQCFWYFRHDELVPKFRRILKENGRIVVLYMAWLPFDDELAAASEVLVLKYNPKWSGAREILRPIEIPKCYEKDFKRIYSDEFKLKVHFSRQSWHGRVKACRAIGASLSQDELEAWEIEHIAMLENIALSEFDIMHYAAIAELQRL